MLDESGGTCVWRQKRSCDNLNLDSFGCNGHSLHLVVRPFLTESKKPEDSNENVVHDVYFTDDDSDVDVFDDEDSFEDNSEEIVIRVRRFVLKFRNLAKYVKNSCKAKEKIRHFDSTLESKYRDTIHISLDVKTRWNSALDMLQSLIKMKIGLQSFVHYVNTSAGKKEFNYKKLPNFSERDWLLMEGLCLVLQPFKEVSPIFILMRLCSMSKAEFQRVFTSSDI